ncbi:MAG TPA: nucleotide exchange factor GrpE [Candidatus Bathyarchaeia archaeon]|nr:nucleotide exchange factor GrpE [Candidatus Bathyarchaeia archaeon]
MHNNGETEKIVQEGTDMQNGEIDRCYQLLDEWKEKCLRISADFENFKRRSVKETELLQHIFQAAVCKDCIKIADDFDRAFHQLDNMPIRPEEKSWIEGFVLIRKSFTAMLMQFGVVPMNNYDIFDPLYHEAIMEVASDTHEPGTIVQVLEKGYFLHDKVLRPAKVSIAIKK